MAIPAGVKQPNCQRSTRAHGERDATRMSINTSAQRLTEGTFCQWRTQYREAIRITTTTKPQQHQGALSALNCVVLRYDVTKKHSYLWQIRGLLEENGFIEKPGQLHPASYILSTIRRFVNRGFGKKWQYADRNQAKASVTYILRSAFPTIPPEYKLPPMLSI